MKSLKNALSESLLDDETLINNDESIIRQFIEVNYNIYGNYSIEGNIVNVNGSISLKNSVAWVSSPREYKSIPNIPLTNGLFKFGKVTKNFICSGSNMKTLEGAPEEVGGDFKCCLCPGLKTLEGSPKIVKGNFYCIECPKIKTLEGSPKKVFGDIYANECISLQSLKGAPNLIGGVIKCFGCPKLNDKDTFKNKESKLEGFGKMF